MSLNPPAFSLISSARWRPPPFTPTDCRQTSHSIVSHLSLASIKQAEPLERGTREGPERDHRGTREGPEDLSCGQPRGQMKISNLALSLRSAEETGSGELLKYKQRPGSRLELIHQSWKMTEREMIQAGNYFGFKKGILTTLQIGVEYKNPKV